MSSITKFAFVVAVLAACNAKPVTVTVDPVDVIPPSPPADPAPRATPSQPGHDDGDKELHEIIGVSAVVAAKAVPYLMKKSAEHDAEVADEQKATADAIASLDTLVTRVDKLIEDRDYDRAALEASKIRWPIHGSMYDVKNEKYEKDYDELREARLAIIARHAH